MGDAETTNATSARLVSDGFTVPHFGTKTFVNEPVSRSKSKKLLTMPAGKLVSVLLLVAVPTGCGRYEAVSLTAPEGGTATVTPLVAAGRAYVTQEGLSVVMLDVLGKTMGLLPVPRPYDHSAAALAEVLKRAGGRASIGIKAP